MFITVKFPSALNQLNPHIATLGKRSVVVVVVGIIWLDSWPIRDCANPVSHPLRDFTGGGFSPLFYYL